MTHYYYHDEGFPPREPQDDAERDAVAFPHARMCNGMSPLTFGCTRTLNHAGDHVAGTNGGKIVARWRNNG
jgi:hypothetical protein